MKNTFTEDDVKRCSELLNLVAQKAEFKLDVAGVIEFFKLLQWSQKDLLPKLEANILEVKSFKTEEELKGEPKSNKKAKK